MLNRRVKVVIPILVLVLAGLASATPVNIITNSTQGYYNQAIGTTLDGSTGFPTAPSDPNVPPIAPQPDLSMASGILGSWLTNPGSLNANWSIAPQAIPSTWAVNTETAIIYKFDVADTSNIVGNFGVDNGLYVWLDGVYVFGAMAPGGVGTYEYPNELLGTVGAGTHYLQVMREDHGGLTGYTALVTAETAPVPEPASLALFGSGVLMLGRRFRRK